ncbi:hypothetical protein DESC_350033 [Desulfosarcina cetonica]|nr:hypothetical protein DESC_350033 [Desulfosarcina cetonica]
MRKRSDQRPVQGASSIAVFHGAWRGRKVAKGAAIFADFIAWYFDAMGMGEKHAENYRSDDHPSSFSLFFFCANVCCGYQVQYRTDPFRFPIQEMAYRVFAGGRLH